MLFSTYCQTDNGKDPVVTFGELLKHVITLCGQSSVRGTDGDPPPLSLLSPVCKLKTPVRRFKTSPCVPAPRRHVVTHVRVVPVHTGTF